MYVQINCVVVDADANNRRELSAVLAQYGVNLVGQFSTPDTLANLLSQADPPQLVVINLDPNAADTLNKVAKLPRQFPQINFFLMSQTVDANVLMQAMHLGVKEFIPLPIPEEKFAMAIERVTQQFGTGKRAKLIHVIPTIGGCGSTTVACNVAASLGSDSRTALIDLDLVRGGAAGYFDMRPRYTIADVMASGEKIDRQVLDTALAVHPTSKVALLARPDLPEDTQRVNVTGLTRLLSILGRMYEYVVMDSQMSIDPLYTTAIKSADLNLIVMQLNVHSARNAERFVGALRRMGVESSKVRIVVNRYVKKSWDIDPKEVERALGLQLGWMIPNDFKNAISAVNYGQPVVLRAPKSEMGVSLKGLASALVEQTANSIAA